MSDYQSGVTTEKAARGQTIVTSYMPDRDSIGDDAAKKPRKVKGEGNDLSRTISSDGKVPSY